ncbi:MAG TPA: FAD-dependent oxidoreductase [Conexibacter sp.]|jgi:3-phenylpropionate/trans-cinnamate dioxygenase ferredoxin reductase subunit|nr:FAD-dependent oxidoreductase [Conexibacter sp.]
MADRHVAHLLIGGGLASANCARWLRESGAEGEILLVGREPEPPYNRPPCSKGYLQGHESRDDTYFRPNEWWEEQRIDLRTRTSVMKLDTAAREATLSSKETVSYDSALLATGANVRRLNVDGAELEGIHYLRALGNADTIRADADGKKVVLIGGSYIGCEVAASLVAADHASCEIVMQEAITLSRGFGETAGGWFQERLEEHGIVVHGEDELERFEGADGGVTHVITKGGKQLEADCVVIGAGVMPDVMLARAAGLTLDEERGGVLCDAQLRTSAPGVWAAGDVASYESRPNGRRIRVEHWDVAFNHGKTVALNMLGQEVEHDVVPYFFSDLADWASLEYVGPAASWDREIVRGSLEEGKFSVWYLAGGRVEGALSVGRSDDLEHARRLIARRTDLGERVDALADLGSDLAAL